VQQSEGVFFALTQAPAKQPSQLLRLEKHGNKLLQVAATPLPSREGGDGGADVLLAGQKDAVFATDRDLEHGWIHYYQYKSGGFQLQTSHRTGNHPRHAAVLPSGDVLVCNRLDGTLTSFPGLARHPLKNVQSVVVEALPKVSFVLPGVSARHAKNEWNACNASSIVSAATVATIVSDASAKESTMTMTTAATTTRTTTTLLASKDTADRGAGSFKGLIGLVGTIGFLAGAMCVSIVFVVIGPGYIRGSQSQKMKRTLPSSNSLLSMASGRELAQQQV